MVGGKAAHHCCIEQNKPNLTASCAGRAPHHVSNTCPSAPSRGGLSLRPCRRWGAYRPCANFNGYSCLIVRLVCISTSTSVLTISRQYQNSTPYRALVIWAKRTYNRQYL